jgi:hypothetical protein
MTKEEFTEQLGDLLEQGIQIGMSREEFLGIVAYRCFALYLSYAEITAKLNEKYKEGSHGEA